MFKEYTDKLAKELAEKIKANYVAVKDASAENGTFKVIASTEDVDRHGEIVKADGRQLENYLKNGIVLFGHDYRSIDSIMGKATKTYVEDGKLIIEGVFAGTESAQVMRKLYDEGVIKTVSVGFRVLERDEENKTVITKAELLEVSFVPVPANQNALSLDEKMMKKALDNGFIEEELKELSNEDSLQYQLQAGAKQAMNEVDGRFRVVAIFANEFVFNHYHYSDEESVDKYYRLSYAIDEAGKATVDGEPVEVKADTQRVDVVKHLKENQNEVIIQTLNALTEKVDTLQKNIESMDSSASNKSDKTDEADKQKKAEQELKKIAGIVSRVLHTMK